jgi:hypothetical protein
VRKTGIAALGPLRGSIIKHFKKLNSTPISILLFMFNVHCVWHVPKNLWMMMMMIFVTLGFGVLNGGANCKAQMFIKNGPKISLSKKKKSSPKSPTFYNRFQ